VWSKLLLRRANFWGNRLGRDSSTWQPIARRIRVPAGFAFAALYPFLARPIWKSILSGTVIIILGIIVRGLASGHLNKNERLAMTGPYAYSRNPLYLGSLILGLGFAVAALSWWVAALLVLIFVAIYMPVIRAEESYLRLNFPEFADYARDVPRILPRPASSHGHHRNFSWELYLKHREYNAALGSAALIAALVAKLFWSLHHASTSSFIFWH
jgi:protein-S-isoprenylcysteine O-methyltransferase Ste14